MKASKTKHLVDCIFDGCGGVVVGFLPCNQRVVGSNLTLPKLFTFYCVALRIFHSVNDLTCVNNHVIILFKEYNTFSK